MLNRSLENLGDAFLRNRQLEQHKREKEQEFAEQRLQTELQNQRESTATARAEAQQAHFNQMESLQTNTDRRQLNQQVAAQKQEMLKSIIALNATGSISDDALSEINNWLHGDEHFGVTGLQLQKPANPKTSGKDAAVVNMLKQADAYDQLAQSETNPDEAATFSRNAALLRKAVEKEGQFAPAHGYETVKTAPIIDKMTNKQTGVATNRTVKIPISAPVIPPPTNPVAPTNAAPATGAIPMAPENPTQRIKGQRYKSAKNPSLSAVWTGQGWQTDATPVAVPGFGAAKP